jgi:hypothetical protein
MRVIVAGSRDITDSNFVFKKLDHLLSIYKRKENSIEIVSGKARGVDTLGEEWAISRNQKISSYPADWDKYGKSAGYIRNEEMAKYATHLIAFWDGRSKGTKHMIDLAKKHGLQIRVVIYN